VQTIFVFNIKFSNMVFSITSINCFNALNFVRLSTIYVCTIYTRHLISAQSIEDAAVGSPMAIN